MGFTHPTKVEERVCRVGRAATRRWPTGSGGPGGPAPRSESRLDPPYQHVAIVCAIQAVRRSRTSKRIGSDGTERTGVSQRFGLFRPPRGNGL